MRRVKPLCAALTIAAALTANASGPRYVTGPPYFTAPAGQPIGWRQTTLQYSTDPGALSSNVSHSAADALVAAAASVWNVPQASVTLGQGGQLAEHVSSADVYLGQGGLVWPADVASSNAGAIPIAVIYDFDGSVTDTLLGAGASSPSSCRQNAVTESVDSFDPAGYILHAIIVINGRCTSTAAAAQAELEYKLVRTFGRVLGLAWSQVNDNVFTGTPTPTYNQAAHWPLMHPIDILCGPYAYQCLPSPFQLRPDDIAGLVALYPVPAGSMLPGKQPSLASAGAALGFVNFPTGEGMAGVNVLFKRETSNSATPEGWSIAGAVTGSQFRRAGSSPFVVASTSATGSMGSTDQNYLGYYYVPYIPEINGAPYQNLVTVIEAVNPLYTGNYSVGPYAAGVVTPSGSAPAPLTTYTASAGSSVRVDVPVPDAAGTCGSGTDGTAQAPSQADASGWWTGLMCGYGHTAYLSFAARASRTFTVEVTALDAQGLATTSKAMPVIGVYGPGDDLAGLPDLAAATMAFNAPGIGMTSVNATAQQGSLTVAIADERGDGRPDLRYGARILYADQVTPARIPLNGGTVTISGMGFRTGNQVLVNGVAATVTGWSNTAITATVPAMTVAQASADTAVDVMVLDTTTQGSSTLQDALTYDPAAGGVRMLLVAAPSGSAYVGSAAAPAFAVRTVAADGTTPVPGEAVVFTVTAGTAILGACGASACTVRTDVNGNATTTITPGSGGVITVQATDGAATQSASLTGIAQAASIQVLAAPAGTQTVGQQTSPGFAIRVLDTQGNGMAARAVRFTAVQGSVSFAGCASSACTLTTDSTGYAGIFLTPTAAGNVTLQVEDGNVTQQASFTAVAPVDLMQLVTAPSASAYVNESAGNFVVRLLKSDGITPDFAQPVVFTATAGLTFVETGTTTCLKMTDGSGLANANVQGGPNVGIYTVQAAFGSVTQSASVTLGARSNHIVILGAPSGDIAVGTIAATSFSAQVTDSNGVPIAGARVTLSGQQGLVELEACGLSSCWMTADANGTVSSAVKVLTSGTVNLQAVFTPLVATTSFTAVGAQETLAVLQQPGASGVLVGDSQTLTAQVTRADGTRYAGDVLRFSVVSGPFALTSCGYALCSGSADETGTLSVSGTAWAAGDIIVQVTDGIATQLITFSASAKPDVLHLVSAPSGTEPLGAAAAPPFVVQLLAGDGVTPLTGHSVSFAAQGAAVTFSGCGSPCVVQTDSNGSAAVTVTPLAVGNVQLLATETGVSPVDSVSAAFTAVSVPAHLQIVSAPANGAIVGVAAAARFTVRVLQADGLTPVRGVSVAVSATNSNATFSACGWASCTLVSDSDGLVSTQVMPLAAGSITLLASLDALSASAAFTAVAAAEHLLLVSAPDTSVYEGAVSSMPFAVRLLQPDGVTPAAGAAITIAASGTGVVTLPACGSAGVCTLTTDASGLVQTGVAGSTAGSVTLTASATGSSSTETVSVSLTVVANVRSVTPVQPELFVAEGAAVSLEVDATLVQNGSPAAAQPVVWNAGAGYALLLPATVTGTNGLTWNAATLGPLAAGQRAQATVCAWSAVCAALGATGVPAAALQPIWISGAVQSITGGSSYQPVIVQVQDPAGHPVLGAAVSIYQQVFAASTACVTGGRCPAQPVLATQANVLTTDANGQVALQPISIAGQATVTRIAVATGLQGYAGTSLSSAP